MAMFDYMESDAALLDRCEYLSTMNKKNDVKSSTYHKKYLKSDPWFKRKRKYEKAYNTHVGIVTMKKTGEPIGYCITCLYDRGRRGVIEEMYVVEDYRDRGIGSKLMQRALYWLEDKVDAQEIFVVHNNTQALRFCEKFDFYPMYYQLKRK